MSLFLFLLGAAVAAIAISLFERFGAKSVETLLADLATTRNRLLTWADGKLLEVADHLEEIALHRAHVDVKQADAARAKRIAAKIEELLQ